MDRQLGRQMEYLKPDNIKTKNIKKNILNLWFAGFLDRYRQTNRTKQSKKSQIDGLKCI